MYIWSTLYKSWSSPCIFGAHCPRVGLCFVYLEHMVQDVAHERRRVLVGACYVDHRVTGGQEACKGGGTGSKLLGITFLIFSIWPFLSLEHQLAALTASFALFANCRTGTLFLFQIVVLDQDPNHLLCFFAIYSNCTRLYRTILDLKLLLQIIFLAKTKGGVFFKLLVVNLCLHFGGRQMHLAQHSTACQKHDGNRVVNKKQKPQKVYAITFQSMTPARKNTVSALIGAPGGQSKSESDNQSRFQSRFH